MRKTKIVCTLGPSTDDPKIMRELIESGMNVARFNFSHQTHKEHKERMEVLCKIRKETGAQIPALIDTGGPQIRLHRFQGGRAAITSGNKFTLYTEEILGDSEKASVTHKYIYRDLQAGARILISDGLIELRADKIERDRIECTVIIGGVISDRKSINVPGVNLSLPYMSDKDRDDIIFAIEGGFDIIAASFVRSATDVIQIRDLLRGHEGDHIKIISKIENAQGVDNIDEIMDVSDGIMVARGDMGVEIPYEQLPAIQKALIKKAYGAGKQVITATQMLESMIESPRPTRAESNDVANAIYDGTSAIMLSGETAAGKYPIEACQAMARIAECAEQDIDYMRLFKIRPEDSEQNMTNAISEATVTTAHNINAKAIITVTKSGDTAKMISKFRPLSPIIGCTTDECVARQMNLSWGVTPILIDEETNSDELFLHSVDRSFEHGLVQKGDQVVITAGVPLGVSGTTNMLKVQTV
ncbi:MAG: pyruvate kinase [Oscillospiraceae bacterium]|nr:pyruvate kinase [Oscillospiraceae bacterium]